MTIVCKAFIKREVIGRTCGVLTVCWYTEQFFQCVTTSSLMLHLLMTCKQNKNWSLVLGFLYGVRGEFSDDVSETAVDPIFTGHESWLMTSKDGTWSGNLPRTPYTDPKTRSQYSFHVESLKLRIKIIWLVFLTKKCITENCHLWWNAVHRQGAN